MARPTPSAWRTGAGDAMAISYLMVPVHEAESAAITRVLRKKTRVTQWLAGSAPSKNSGKDLDFQDRSYRAEGVERLRIQPVLDLGADA